MTEPHVGYIGKQIAHAVSLDTNHANAFVIDAVESAHSSTTGGQDAWAKAGVADTSCARFTPPAKTTRANPGQQWVSMTVDDLAALITGYRHGHRVEPEIA